jgi:uncharacterized ferritin-like protein (DUF455 family)
MELREFAEQVLFSSNLEEKLRPPEEITDRHPGTVLEAPAMPGRPPTLVFKAAGSGKNEFPGLSGLEPERERGKLLHFFANHELLATELMALVLLRFPDAPPAFRAGVLRTLKEEQIHTRMYLRRMEQYGIGFGELPVSGFFWRAVSNMASPIDYVASLSLTFEQANLDFCGHFSRAFDRLGDGATAKLLQRIYEDEIEHVAYGLQWFRKWKHPGQSDWDAFCRALKFPLSPQRAKGFTLNVEGRRRAGLDPDFIANLNVFAQSKGRTPNVFVFNPFSEAYLAEGKSFTPNAAQAMLADDLENLPQFLGRPDDVVLVRRRPGIEFLSGLKEAGFCLPEFVELKKGRIPTTDPLLSRKVHGLIPWAWGPDSRELLDPLSGCLTRKDGIPTDRLSPHSDQLYSKSWSARFLRSILEKLPPAPWLCSPEEVGTVTCSAAEALDAIRGIRARGHHRVVIKQTLGLAGRNALRLWEPALTGAQLAWIEKATRDGREIVVEPWLERELDFSVQLEMQKNRLELRGYTGLMNDARGQYQGNWAAPNFARSLPSVIPAKFPDPPDIFTRLHAFYADLITRLENELRDLGHVGPLGIDAFVFRDGTGAMKLKPVVEINPRYTMGRLTVELMRQVCPGSFGWFRLLNIRQVQAEGFADFAAFQAHLRVHEPLQLDGTPPRIRAGAICLNDAARAKSILAIFQVGRQLPPECQPAPALHPPQ